MSTADRGDLTGTSAPWLRSRFRRYAFALFTVAVAALLRAALGKLLGPNLPFIVFYPVIWLVAWMAGLGPALFAVFLSAVSAHYLLFGPVTPSVLGLPQNTNGLILFAAAGAAISGLADMYRRRAKRLQEFEKAVAGLEEMIAVVDRNHRYVMANRAFLNYRGMKESDLIGRRVDEVLNPGVFETTVKEKLDKCFQGKIVQYEMRYRYATQGERDLLISYLPIWGAGGVDRVACILRDITERKRADEALRESEDRYRDLIEHSEDLVCTHDLEGRLLSANPAPARVLGYEVTELLKIPMREIIAPEFRDQFDAYLARIKTTGADKGLMCVLTRSGERRIWEYSNTLRTEGVASPIVRGMAHDVTEKMRAEAALRQREEDYRRFVAQSSEGIFRLDLDQPIPTGLPEDELAHGILYGSYLAECNDAMAKMYGLESARDVLGKRLTETLDAGDPHNIELTREYVRSGFRVVERESHEVDLHGNPKVFLNSLIGIVENGKLLRTWGIQRDVTKRVKAEEAQRKAEQGLVESEERFRVAIQNSPMTVFCQDRNLRYTWIYNAHLFVQEAIIGKTDDELVGADQARPLNEIKRRVLETGKGVREEVVVAHNGKKYSFDMTLEPLRDAAGGVVGITGAAMDIARLREFADSLQTAKERLVQEKLYLQSEIQTELGFEQIIGQSPALREVLKQVRVVAPTDSTVLLLGETGTGKELVARAIHSLSARQDKNFIKLNCAAVPTGLLESELFGHEKGAFTGAVNQKIGRLELADKGSLFLDEIGELPLELQPKLLRVLQDREFERLGGIRTLRVNVRVISATNRDLRKDVAEKRFREDLFYRLNVFPIAMPALRERRSDIPALVHHFVQKHAVRMGKRIETIPDETMKVLHNWSWPGNIRELENMIERMVILTKGGVLAPPSMELDGPQEWLGDNLTEMEREHIVRVLQETKGVLSGPQGAASRLGVKRTTLQSMLKRFGIEPQEFRRGTGTYGPE